MVAPTASASVPTLPATVAPDRALLGHVLAALSREATPERVYAHAMDAVAMALAVDRAAVLIFDRDAACRFVAWRGLSDAYRDAVDGHSPWTPDDLDACPWAVADIEREPTLREVHPALRAEAIRSALFLPLVGRARVWGKFMLYGRNERIWSADELEVANRIAHEVAVTLDWHERDRALQSERELFAGGPTVVCKWRYEDEPPIEYVSANVEAVFGYPATALMRGDVRYRDIVCVEDRAHALAELQHYVASGAAAFEQEYRVVHADGRLRVVHDHTRVVRDETGAVTHLLGYLTDISERRAAEAELGRMREQVQHAQKLESLGILAGGIAHDFNNLLVGVLGNAALAMEELPASSPAHPLLEDLQMAARRASELTRQLLAYSGKGRFVVEPVELSGLVREMGRLLSAALSKKAQIVTDLRDDLPPVQADATQVRQIVMNLLTNASDALEDAPGTITIRTRRMHASRAWLAGAHVGADIAEGEYLVLEVSDTGVGMSPDMMPRLFEPFFSTKGAGRGLGLAAVLGIVRSHKGAVRITSVHDSGTTVAILLPVSSADGAASALPDPLPNVVRGTVLVVDDDEAALRVAERTLLRDGYRVLAAPHGRAALDVYAERGPSIDLVLLDLTMPELSGWETLQELKLLDPAVLVLLMSGYAHEAGADTAGAAGFLPKPYGPAELRAAISTVLEGRRTRVA